MKSLTRIVFGLVLPLQVCAEGALKNAEIWPDDRGVHVNAHGGCVLAHEGRYWLYGEHKIAGKAGNRAHGTAVHAYSSDDLVRWKDEGAALVCSRDPNSDIRDNAVIERPKVLFCAKTGKFVMRFHLERGDAGYFSACTGVAVSDVPQGPFRYLHGSRANAGCWPQNGDPAKCNRAYFESCMRPEILKYNLSGGPNELSRERDLYVRDYDGGQMTRDMTLFVDDDGVAYQISASEENSTLQIAELTDDYLNFTGRFWRMAEKEWTEAPAVCKRGGWYYLIGSGCTGWAPNTARLYRSKRLTGPWEKLGNPCRGSNSVTGIGADLTWGGQSNFILKVPGRDLYVAMFDIWRPENAIDGRYVWLPIDFGGETPVIRWRDVAPDAMARP